mmetsp:Transcript_18623/g.60729  ORF Transcript_18623/g.60729 Transcript_18623/m.60729 type:complete len:293 (+) Transcript_18623:1-879(+)
MVSAASEVSTLTWLLLVSVTLVCGAALFREEVVLMGTQLQTLGRVPGFLETEVSSMRRAEALELEAEEATAERDLRLAGPEVEFTARTPVAAASWEAEETEPEQRSAHERAVEWAMELETAKVEAITAPSPPPPPVPTDLMGVEEALDRAVEAVMAAPVDVPKRRPPGPPRPPKPPAAPVGPVQVLPLDPAVAEAELRDRVEAEKAVAEAASQAAAEAERELAEAQSKCQDSNRFCVGWAADGKCKDNRVYMAKACPRACQFCAEPVTTFVAAATRASLRAPFDMHNPVPRD